MYQHTKALHDYLHDLSQCNDNYVFHTLYDLFYEGTHPVINKYPDEMEDVLGQLCDCVLEKKGDVRVLLNEALQISGELLAVAQKDHEACVRVKLDYIATIAKKYGVALPEQGDASIDQHLDAVFEQLAPVMKSFFVGQVFPSIGLKEQFVQGHTVEVTLGVGYRGKARNLCCMLVLQSVDNRIEGVQGFAVLMLEFSKDHKFVQVHPAPANEVFGKVNLNDARSTIFDTTQLKGVMAIANAVEALQQVERGFEVAFDPLS